MKVKVSEKETQKLIIEYLKATRQFFWRNNSGAMMGSYKGKSRLMRFGDVGSPDIFVVRNGQIIGIEVKSSIGKQSDNQKEWQKRFEKAGGIYILTNSYESCVSNLKRL